MFIHKYNQNMELVAKISLTGTLTEMPLGAVVDIPATLFKETSVRNIAVRVANKTGHKFRVAVNDGGCKVRRTA